VTRRFKRGLAAIFVLQIVLPLVAPLQMLDLRDLFGIQVHRSAVPAPESTTTPAMSEATSDTVGVSLVATAAGSGPVASLAPAQLSTRVSLASSFAVPAAPQVQRSVLRV
jgi:hypothetical protein